MINFKNVLFLALMFVTTLAVGQKDIGMVKYEVTNVESDNPQMASQLGMLKNGSMTIHENDSKVLFIQNMGGMMVTKILSNKDTEGQTMYMDMMGQKIMIDMSKEEVAEMQNKNDDTEGPKVTKFMDETKEILGYECYKVMTTMESPQGNVNTTLYVTEDLASEGQDKIIQGQDVDLSGFPLEMTTEMSGQFSMTYQAKDIKMRSEVDEKAFEIDETGYEKKTFDEMSKMMGGMGGM